MKLQDAYTQFLSTPNALGLRRSSWNFEWQYIDVKTNIIVIGSYNTLRIEMEPSIENFCADDWEVVIG
jgi:hypothetical protein